MTTIAQPIEAEYDFPDTGAKPTKNYGKMNGYIFEFLNSRNEPDAVFIEEHTEGAAIEAFENKYPLAFVINHTPGIQVYDF
jgi:hypothetical protein